MQLTYNRSNALGARSSEPETRGLTDLGRQAVERLNANRILVDVAHANPRTMIDTAAASNTPITISHTGCRAVYDHQRSSPDDLRAVADRAGGRMYLMPFSEIQERGRRCFSAISARAEAVARTIRDWKATRAQPGRYSPNL